MAREKPGGRVAVQIQFPCDEVAKQCIHGSFLLVRWLGEGARAHELSPPVLTSCRSFSCTPKQQNYHFETEKRVETADSGRQRTTAVVGTVIVDQEVHKKKPPPISDIRSVDRMNSGQDQDFIGVERWTSDRRQQSTIHNPQSTTRNRNTSSAES